MQLADIGFWQTASASSASRPVAASRRSICRSIWGPSASGAESRVPGGETPAKSVEAGRGSGIYQIERRGVDDPKMARDKGRFIDESIPYSSCV
ncbi:hypothetical protein CHELA40_11702 [Chelatococcus asaccharovorans]|nr:hypothetical protein CHELA40_11702 [Chelatococcus asaccharovorans]CAH1684241.1 hypothetical protein CHELA17_63901 [Chelatococcus asaccharovorans]